MFIFVVVKNVVQKGSVDLLLGLLFWVIKPLSWLFNRDVGEDLCIWEDEVVLLLALLLLLLLLLLDELIFAILVSEVTRFNASS